MRHLEKGPTPLILVTRGAEWTENYVRAAGPEERRKAERWRHPDIKSSLRRETSAKCVYCEAYIDDVAFPHVEHIIPKSVSPELAHEWNNMTNACERCNIGKGNYYDATHPFVDPYAPGVELRITAQGAIVDWLRGDQGAEITVGRLGLNRYELVTSRITRINHMRALVERWHTSASTLKQVLEETIIRETIEGEFTQTVVWLLHVHHFPLPAHLAPEGIVVDVA